MIYIVFILLATANGLHILVDIASGHLNITSFHFRFAVVALSTRLFRPINIHKRPIVVFSCFDLKMEFTRNFA